MLKKALKYCYNLERKPLRLFTRTFKNELKVSESAPVSMKDITKHLDYLGMGYQKGHACITTTCPSFTKPKLKLNKVDQLYINKTTGYFVCANCKKSGPWEKLRDHLSLIAGSFESEQKTKPLVCFKSWTDDIICEQSEYEAVSQLLSTCLTEPLGESEFDSLTQRLDMVGLKQTTFTDYKVQVLPNGDGVVFPSCDINAEYHWAKIVTSTNSQVQTKTLPRQQYIGLFGWHLAKSRKKVVLTSSEADAMAVYQETGVAAIALPRGYSTLPQQVLPLLESFNNITVWFDNSVPAFESAKVFAKKLGVKRTTVVRPEINSPSPLKALQKGHSLKNILATSISLLHEHVIMFGSHRDDVKNELMFAEHVAGVKWKHFPKLTEMLKGHRRGELTVFTGGTGSGKTTFLSNYSLDLCCNGNVNTLWGSFEITNVKLMKTMIQQFARKDLAVNIDEYDMWADQFEQLLMYYMNFHGQENILRVIETMSHAVYIYDIAHVIVDNLQFMMGTTDSNYDRFSKQDQIVGRFRQFATKMNCHVTLVIHPRKEDGDALTTNSIFGGAKASQEADNILILQTTENTKYLQIAKNRFDGTLGAMRLKFDKECKSFWGKAEKSQDTASNDAIEHTRAPSDATDFPSW